MTATATQQKRARVQQNKRAAEVFAALLRARRTQLGYSLRILGEHAGIPFQWISEMELGQRPCGPRTAEKLASGLQLDEASPDYSAFLYTAAATMKVAGLIAQARDFPPAILDGIASRLRELGLRGMDVNDAVIFTKQYRHLHDGRDLEIGLRNGRCLYVTISIAEKHRRST